MPKKQRDKSQDLDETRRLLYMALAVPHTDRYELVGTITNALAHHGSDLNPDDVMEHLIRTVSDPDAGEWAREQIARITTALGD